MTRAILLLLSIACTARVSALALSLDKRTAITPPLIGRRIILAGGAAVAASGLFLPNAVLAADDDGMSSPIAVIGANGRTGSLCVTSCLRRDIPVRALTRTGSWQQPLTETADNFDERYSNLLSVRECDVKIPTELASSVTGCRGVIYAASASKKGGSPKEIDNLAVVAAGEACLAAKVNRYVVISSTAVTRPKSLGFVFTNVSMGGIMDEKRKGEDGVISAYNGAAASSAGCSYSIIRPGGLEEPKKNSVLGPPALELSQGDALAGIISRADLAEVAVEAALTDAPNLRNAAFECYYTDSAQPCEGRFKSLLEGGGDVMRMHGDTYENLFHGIKPDGRYYVPT